MSTEPQPFILTVDEATQLRDALRLEQQLKDYHELAVLRTRVAILEAVSARRALFEAIADQHQFDATDSFEFDFQSRTLTITKGNTNGATS